MFTGISTTTSFVNVSLVASYIVTEMQLITLFSEFARTVKIPIDAITLTFPGLVEVGLIRFADEIIGALAGLRARAAAAAATLLALAGTFRRVAVATAAAAAAVGNITAFRSPLRLSSFLRRRLSITALRLVVLVLEQDLQLLLTDSVISVVQSTTLGADHVEHNTTKVQLIRTGVIEVHATLFPRIDAVLLEAGDDFENHRMGQPRNNVAVIILAVVNRVSNRLHTVPAEILPAPPKAESMAFLLLRKGELRISTCIEIHAVQE